LISTNPLEAEYKKIMDTVASYLESKFYELVELYKFKKRYQKHTETGDELTPSSSVRGSRGNLRISRWPHCADHISYNFEKIRTSYEQHFHKKC
jgi:acyl-ACP thioesterase